MSNPFSSSLYLRHSARRLEHLSSLRIPVAGMSVLEVGAGNGDHSHYYLDRGCRITITDSRPENIQIIQARYPNQDVYTLDMENPSLVGEISFDIVHCYGLLYHLKDPEQALKFLSQCTKKMLFLETCVSFGEQDELYPVSEDADDLSQASSGTGCRPTRSWLFKRLSELFGCVYLPKTQPNHEEFPLDWVAPEKHKAGLQRAIFIASRDVLENEILTKTLIEEQIRHE